MRVSTQAFFQNNVLTLQRLQRSLNDLQEQVATGRQIQRPSDDPVGSARALNLRESIDSVEQFQRNAGLAESRLRLEEETLTGVTELLQRARELALQAANATQTNESRDFVAAELRQGIDQLLALANTRDSSDDFLFAGYQTQTQPFTRTSAGFSYNGDQGQRFVSISRTRQIPDSDSGERVFGRIREGNGQVLTTPAAANTGTGTIFNNDVAGITGYNFEAYQVTFTAADAFEVRDGGGVLVSSGAFTPGDSITFGGLDVRIEGEPATGDVFDVGPSPNTDMFSIIDRLAAALETPVADEAQRAGQDAAINRGIEGLDQALARVLEVRTGVGSRLATIESQVDANAGASLVLQESLADIEDLDYAAAISALTQQATTLEAAQQSFLRIQNLSLFRLL
ncbi:MAG: flagellar hook-associated protein FlgL [Pseudomonadota bacterium]